MNTPDYIMTLVTFFVGYAIGQGKLTHESIKEAEKEVEKAIKQRINPQVVGPVNRPTASKVNMWADKKRTEEDEYMSAELEKLMGKPV